MLPDIQGLVSPKSMDRLTPRLFKPDLSGHHGQVLSISTDGSKIWLT